MTKQINISPFAFLAVLAAFAWLALTAGAVLAGGGGPVAPQERLQIRITDPQAVEICGRLEGGSWSCSDAESLWYEQWD